MARRFAFPEDMQKRLGIALGILVLPAVYGILRIIPFTRPALLYGESAVARLATRSTIALRYVFSQQTSLQDPLALCTEERAFLSQELARLTYETLGPLRTFPVHVLARAYGGRTGEILVWNAEGGGFVLESDVFIGSALVGKIVRTEKDFAVVRLLIDEESKIPAMILGKEATIGIVEGTGGAWLELRYVPKGSNVAVGDSVVTRGEHTQSARGLVLGTVREVIDADPSPFYRILVEPTLSADTWWSAEVQELPVL